MMMCLYVLCTIRVNEHPTANSPCHVISCIILIYLLIVQLLYDNGGRGEFLLAQRLKSDFDIPTNKHESCGKWFRPGFKLFHKTSFKFLVEVCPVMACHSLQWCLIYQKETLATNFNNP